MIGENGKGKSSLLQGLRIAVGGLLHAFEEIQRGPLIEQDDVRRIDLEHRFAPQLPVHIDVDGKIGATQLTVEWHQGSPALGLNSWDAVALAEYAYLLQHQTNKLLKEVEFPVLLYFSTARLWLERSAQTALKTKGTKIADGYDHCLDTSRDKITALSWIKSNYYKDLKSQSRKGEGNQLLAAVLEAISVCVPGWTALEWDEDSDDLAGMYPCQNRKESIPSEEDDFFADDEPEKGILPLRYLSDGLRTMAGMAAEIAYRCVILNGHHGREAARLSRGVVLIDELDMHLHPNWQRQVVGDLKKAFPNLQFVATTHSPFIVQALETNELINLDEPTDLRPKDLSLEQVAESVMGVESPFGVENQEKEDLTVEYINTLETFKENDSTSSLDAIEARVSDPGLRALLQMKRLKKGL